MTKTQSDTVHLASRSPAGPPVYGPVQPTWERPAGSNLSRTELRRIVREMIG